MITYPVSKESRWSIWSISEGRILPNRHNIRWPVRDGGPIPGLSADAVPLLEVSLEQPVYDSTTQRLKRTEGVVDVANNTHTHGWEIVAIPQAELDAAAELDTVKSLYQDLKNGVGTNLERLDRVERVLAHLLKAQYIG